MFLTYFYDSNRDADHTCVLVKFVSTRNHPVLPLLYAQLELPHSFWHKEIDTDSVTLLLYSPQVIVEFELCQLLIDLSDHYSGLVDIVVVTTTEITWSQPFHTGLTPIITFDQHSVVPTEDLGNDMYYHTCLELLRSDISSVTPDLQNSYNYLCIPDNPQEKQLLLSKTKYSQLTLQSIQAHLSQKQALYQRLGLIWELHDIAAQLLMYRTSTTPLARPAILTKKPAADFGKYIADQPNLVLSE